jgi:multiple sugar transport system substrate-binding protein
VKVVGAELDNTATAARILSRPDAIIICVSPALTRAALLLAVCLLSLSGGACADRSPRPGPVTVVFKHAKILGPVDPIPGLIREFEATHPSIRVKAESLPWNSDEQRQFLVINLEGGRPGFDVMMLDCIWVPEFARAGWVLDLTPYVAPGELAAHFDSAVSAASYERRIWALPWMMNVGLLYYRADLLAKHNLSPPRTYAEMVDQIRLVRRVEGNPRLDGYLWQGKQYEGLVVNVLEGLWAAGTGLLGEDGRVLPDAQRAQEVLGFLRMLIDSGMSPPWVTAADEEITRRAFGKGEAIFLRSWPYAADLFELPDSAVRGRVGLAPLPRHAGGQSGPGSTGGSHLAVTRHTRHPEAAVALARFFTGERAQRAMTETGATKPTRRALYHDPALVRRFPTLPAIHDLTLGGRPRPVTPYYVMMSTTVQPEFSAALVHVKSPARSVSDAQRRLQFLLEGAGG